MSPRTLLQGALPIRTRLAPLPQCSVNAARAARTFATTRTLHKAPRGGDLGYHMPKSILPAGVPIPPYPYGEARYFKQQNKGLYGAQMIQFGNNVSPKTETKSRRSWKPNVLNKALYSVALKKRIMLRLTSKVLKVIDREGGLDEYLLKESETRIKELGPLGWALRWRLMQHPSVIARFRAEAAALGLAQDIIDREYPLDRPAFRLALKQAEAAKKEAADAVAAKKAAIDKDRYVVQGRRAVKRMAILHYTNDIRKRKLAPTRAMAEKEALPMAIKEYELLKYFKGDRRLLREYRWAQAQGEVFDQGPEGRGEAEALIKWTAQKKAARLYKEELAAGKREKLEKAEHERRMADRSVREVKDWAELTPAQQEQQQRASA